MSASARRNLRHLNFIDTVALLANMLRLAAHVPLRWAVDIELSVSYSNWNYLLLFGQERHYGTYDANNHKNCRPSNTKVKYRFVAETNRQENTYQNYRDTLQLFFHIITCLRQLSIYRLLLYSLPRYGAMLPIKISSQTK